MIVKICKIFLEKSHLLMTAVREAILVFALWNISAKQNKIQQVTKVIS